MHTIHSSLTRRTLIHLLILCSLLASLLPQALFASARQSPIEHPLQQSQAPSLKLQVGSFIPGQNALPLDPELTLSGYPAGQVGYYIVQFIGPVKRGWKAQVIALGAQLLDYIPDYAYKVRMTPEQAAQVQNLVSVQWVGIFQPGYKLSLALNDEVAGQVGLYAIDVERGADARLIAQQLASQGIQATALHASKILVKTTPAQLNVAAKLLEVAWIAPFAAYEEHNEAAAGVILGGNVANAAGYDGSTQIVAVNDTGLGDGTAAGAHPDIPAARIQAIYNWPGQSVPDCATVTDDGARDVDSGHGTHVAASVLGDGGAKGEGKAAAPAAKLIFQAHESYTELTPKCAGNATGEKGYMPLGLWVYKVEAFFKQAYEQGARIHANSWGAPEEGAYTDDSVQTDAFVWQHPDMLITFSAGNSGIDANNDGTIDAQSLGSPASAKNVIAVGASENQRDDQFACDSSATYPSDEQNNQTCSQMGGKNKLFAYGEWWSNRYKAEPWKSDLSAGNQEQMAGFSSRGPAADGRIKPDLVAPGTWILSGYSNLYQQGDDGDPVNPQVDAYQYDGWGLPFNKFYKYMGGTSMSNPIAAGGATVVRDYYQKAHNRSASAALVKATLINSAVDLLDENNDGANDNDFPLPNIHEGWGRINLAKATDGSLKFVENEAGLQTGGNITYTYNLGSNLTLGGPFKVTLVWSDAPGSKTAAQALVNDLDLVVTAPDGTLYRGNVFQAGWSQAGGSADRLNNVENVFVQSAAAGTWKVEVFGQNVPEGPQPFALVVDAAISEAPEATLSTIQPSLGDSGTSLEVTITGHNTHFVDGKTTADFGDGILVSEVFVESETQAVAQIEIDAEAMPGPRTVRVETGSETVSKENGFSVGNGTKVGAIVAVNPLTMTMRLGEKQNLAIVVAPGDTPVNGVQINGKVDPQVLRLLGVTHNASQLNQVLEGATFNADTGEFLYSAGMLGNVITTPLTVLTLEVQSLLTTTQAGTPISFLSSHPKTDISNPSGSVMEAAHNGTVIVQPGGSSGSASLVGRIDLQGRPAKPHTSWAVPLTVELIPSDGSTVISRSVQSNQSGEFTIDGLPVGVYSVRLKNEHTLSNLVNNLSLKSGSNPFYLATLLEGDVDNRSYNQAVLADFGQLSGAFNKCKTDAGFVENADLDEDGCVAIKDFSLLSENYNKQGDIQYDSPTDLPMPLPLPEPNAILSFGTPFLPAKVGEVLTLPLFVDPNQGEGVSGVTAHFRYDPSLIEVVKIDLITQQLSNVMEAPQIDNQRGTVRFSLGVLGKLLNERTQVATIQVKLKASGGNASLQPANSFPYSDLTGSNGSVLAKVEGVLLLEAGQVKNVYLPMARR